jgi:chondroitin AC lyase
MLQRLFVICGMTYRIRLKKSLLIFSVLLLMTGTRALGQSRDADLKHALSVCQKLLLSDTAYATEQSYRLTDDITYDTNAEGYYQLLTAEGKWNDIDYLSKAPSAWKPSWHLYRIMLLCRAYHKNNDARYLAAIHKALAYWITNDFKCPNWWQNQINVPYAYSSLMLMLNTGATPAELAFLDKTLTPRVQQKNPTGQNKIWQHDIELRIALIHNNADAFAAAINNMQQVITISTKEGIQPDYSFQQHGPMLQFGNYGIHFVNSLLFWIKVTANTSFAFNSDKQKLIFDYCSNGLRWTIFKGAMDVTAVGRQIREDYTTKRGTSLADNFKLIKSLDKNKACSYGLNGFDEQQCIPQGNKSFWRSDHMIQQATGYQMSVKMHGPFVKKVESINFENLKGSFLNDGVCLVRRSGLEYRNIEPLWNWNMLPGTTCDTTTNVADTAIFRTSNISGFVGQVSNGNIGASAMRYNRNNISAYKSYFFINDMVVALGAGIKSAKPDNVITTVDQVYAGRKTVTSGKSKTGAVYYYHDGTAYLFPQQTDITARVHYRSGDWGSIDHGTQNIAKADSVWSIFIGHRKNDSYAYMIKPGIDAAGAKVLNDAPPVTIISNTEQIQALQAKDKVMAVFYLPGTLTTRTGLTITTDKACMLILDRGKLWVADPTRGQTNIHVTIGGKNIDVQLPNGDLKGSTTQVSFK